MPFIPQEGKLKLSTYSRITANTVEFESKDLEVRFFALEYIAVSSHNVFLNLSFLIKGHGVAG